MVLAQTQIDLALATRPRPNRRLRRPRLQRYPLNLERQYQKQLRQVADAAIAKVNALIVPNLDRWARQAGVRQDQLGDWIDDLEAEFTIIRREFERQDGQFRQVAENVSRETSSFNRVEVGRQVSGVVGSTVLPFSDDTDTIRGFINQNVQAIKSIPSQYFEKVERAISEGFRSGRRADSIGAEIVELGQSTRKRANFIARDQVSTLNSQLTQRRQTSLGVEEYIWRTSRDERVRVSHRALEGTRHRWDDPPTVGGRQVHPGEDFACRCTPEPVIEGEEIEVTGPEDIPPPLPRARARRRPRVRAPAAARPRARRRPGPLPDIPITARPEVVPRPRAAGDITLSAEQVLRRDVSAVLSAYPELRQRATTRQRLDRLLWNWIHGTNRKPSVELKKAAVQEFGLRGVAFDRFSRRIDPRDVSQSAKDLRKLYNDTQRHFAETGQRKVTLYRGWRTARGERGAVESWSTKRSEAAKFAGPEGGVEVREVPVEKILAIHGGPHWLDGVWGDQGETMVLF